MAESKSIAVDCSLGLRLFAGCTDFDIVFFIFAS